MSVAKILVADDNSNIQKMVGLALKDQGIDVVAVGNGEAAVRKISDIRPDLVLADVFMPVRNGYEVCRYVKEDSSLSHIPVILLVGAFDPLDEQEAQRVGADGVLKKPFVPPDPLISMVKSALTRAGVPVGPAAEKVPVPSKQSTADILSAGIGSKLAEIAPEKFPEAAAEPLEEFPTVAPHLKIAAGSEPLAFGSLLNTSDAEDLAITSKPMIELAKDRNWEDESDEVEEEQVETEEAGNSWRPSGLGETLERAGETSHAAPDWREEAFHGNSPAESISSTHWAPSDVQPSFAEAAASQNVAVATVETAPAGESVPFASDAWTAAMASGVEDKIAEVKEVAPVTPEAKAIHDQEQPAEHIPETSPSLQDEVEPECAPAVETAASEQSVEPANWAPAPETAWETEAKKASLLASTWDAPKPFSVDETQEIPSYSAELPVEHTEGPTEAPIAESAYAAAPVASNESEEKVEATTEETQANPSVEASEPRSWENTWEAPAAAAAAPVAEEAQIATPQVEEAPVVALATEEAASEPLAATQPVQPDMDELVARVLGKMNPEILQKVTREILKPVIEAIVRDEINSKKS
jgi:CheY-like chemotaxis protein